MLTWHDLARTIGLGVERAKSLCNPFHTKSIILEFVHQMFEEKNVWLFNWQPGFGLIDDSGITDFLLGLLILVLLKVTKSR